MRHGVKLNPLGRKKAHRKAMMRNLTRQLVEHKRITTTLAKAKALRKHVEPILTKSKNDTTHNRRVVFSYVQDKETIKELFGNISQKIASRPGGYTRIIKLDQRLGDNADMAIIELVDYNEVYDTTVEVGAKKKRTRRTRKKKAEAAPAAEAATSEVAEEPATEAAVEAPVAETPETTAEEAPAVADAPAEAAAPEEKSEDAGDASEEEKEA